MKQKNRSILLSIVVLLVCLAFFPQTAMASAKKTALTQKKITMAVTEKNVLTLKNAKEKVTWESSDEEIVTVKGSGKRKSKCKITAVGDGKAVIYATCGKKTYKCKITVKLAQLSCNVNTLEYGKQATVTLNNIKGTASFSVSDTTIAKIISHSNNTVTVQGMKTGKVRITAKYNNVDYAMKLNVTHNHVFNQKTVLKEPTCTENGLQRMDCICGTKGKDTVIYALGHDLKEETLKEPSCSEMGEIQLSCKRCNYTHIKSTAPKGHEWEDDYTIDTEADCSSYGSKSRHCKHCSMTTDSVIIPKEDHDFAVIKEVIPSTCNQMGRELVECQKCKVTLYRQTPSKGHTPNDAWDVITVPNCTNTGIEIQRCSVCGSELDRHVLPKTNHSYDNGEIIKEATCVGEGEILYHCIHCEQTKTEKIPPTNEHSYDKEVIIRKPTCSARGLKYHYCTTDGCNSYKAEEIPALGHHYSETAQFVEGEENNCTKGGYMARYCIRGCGTYTDRQYVPPKGHTYSEEYITTVSENCVTDGRECRICEVCGAKTDERIRKAYGHNFTNGKESIVQEPTCCSLGYKWIYCTNKNCTTHKTESIKTLPHIYDTKGTVYKEATCTEDGELRYYCTGNGVDSCSEYQSEVIKGSHKNDSPYVIEGQTCISRGYLVKYCSVCKKELERKDNTTFGPHKWKETDKILKDAVSYISTKECETCDHTAFELFPSSVETDGLWFRFTAKTCVHKFSGNMEVKSQRGCETEGIKSQKCEKCEEYAYDIYQSLEDKTGFDTSSFIIEEPFGHTWDLIDGEYPVCGEKDGTKTFECLTCKKQKNEIWEKQEAHSFVIYTYKEYYEEQKPEDSNADYIVVCEPNDYYCNHYEELKEEELGAFREANPTAIMYSETISSQD